MIQKTDLIIPLIIVLAIGTFSAMFISSTNEEGELDDIMFFGFELEKLLGLVNGVLAISLFAITFTAFRREHRERMLFVSIAFLLFATRNFLFAHELFIEEIPIIDPILPIIDFFILLTFFYGMLKK